jgi:restriction endonuclease Mrr
VLIDGPQLSRLMSCCSAGCRDEDVQYLKKVDEDFFVG